MKKAYLSLVVVCLVPFIGLSFMMDDFAKRDPAIATLGPSMFPQMGAVGNNTPS